MKTAFIYILFLLFSNTGYSQINHADSLKTVPADISNPLKKFEIIETNLQMMLNFRAGNVDSASTIQLLQIAKQQKNDSLLAIAYNFIGSYFSFTKGDNISALEYFFKGIPLAEKAKDKRRLSSLYFDIALAYYALQNFEEGFKYNVKGGENLPDKSSPMYEFMLVQYQRNAVFYYLQIHRADSALHYGQLATETAGRVKARIFIYNALILTAAAYAQKNDTVLADLYFKRARVMSDSVNLNAAKALFYNNYIEFLLDNRRVQEAKNIAAEMLLLGRQTQNNDILLPATGFMQQVFDSLHITDSAYHYAKMKEKINAEIFSQNNINKIQALAFNEQIRNIEEEAKAKAEEEQRKQNIQFALIALGIISFIIIFLLLSRSIITNTKMIEFLGVVALLIVFEFLNLLLHPFLERVTNHSPVLMLLALVCIAALLVPLHHKLEKWATTKLVEKNKQIRLAAAKKTIEELEKKDGESL